ncbi:hypothetical protein BJ165DRAFT_1487009 [Panaeolus papilionaceus]|nr:hypothetical protein BJ165DRAFT_1487009 [Panaeolus papilionaceus]
MMLDGFISSLLDLLSLSLMNMDAGLLSTLSLMLSTYHSLLGLYLTLISYCARNPSDFDIHSFPRYPLTPSLFHTHTHHSS